MPQRFLQTVHCGLSEDAINYYEKDLQCHKTKNYSYIFILVTFKIAKQTKYV